MLALAITACCIVAAVCGWQENAFILTDHYFNIWIGHRQHEIIFQRQIEPVFTL